MDKDPNTYPHEKKKRLAKKISNLKKKSDMVKIMEIIYEDNKNITENQNGLFMFFHKLNDSTYHKIDLFLRSTSKKKSEDSSSFISSSKEPEIKCLSENDQNVKYSNREKNILKRQRYSEQLQNETSTDQNITYSHFDVNILSDSDNNATPSNLPNEENKVATNTNTTNANSYLKKKGRPAKKVNQKNL